MNGWEGGAIDSLREWLDDPRPPGDEFVEKFLVRVMVRAGVPTGNSQFASQWEGPLGQPADTLALFAVQDLWQGQVPSA